MRRLWPRSLAVRIALLLLAALAAAQAASLVVFGRHEASVVEAIGHSQALGQTVALVRLLDRFPADQADTLTAAFGSRSSCAFVSGTEPGGGAMSDAESRLAAMIQPMLHGVRAGAPRARIGAGENGPLCPDAKPFDPARAGDGAHAPVRDDARGAVVSMIVPLDDGRWLTTRSAIEAEGPWNRTTALSFLLSSLAVAGVGAFAVRAQTKSLRALADASDRFGRGEKVEPLATDGPSEVAAAARAFNTMQERLGRYLQDRLKLIAGISHDLRTPLTALRLKAEFIDDAETRDGIVQTIDELTTITEATLAFSRAESTAEETRTVELADLVAAVAEEFRSTGKPVAVVESASLKLACRPVALKRAVRNLVENAVRYGGAARLSLHERGGSAAIVVDDDGPGIPADRLDDAFKPFVRLEASRSAETGGLGLGLAIASGVVKAHGGTLTLSNRPEGGLSAEILLPRPEERRT